MNGQDFPYWESDGYAGSQSDHRTQPNGQGQVEEKPLQPYPPQPVYLSQPQPQPQSISLPGQGLTLTITTTAVRLDIAITPL